MPSVHVSGEGNVDIKHEVWAEELLLMQALQPRLKHRTCTTLCCTSDRR